MDHAWWGGKRWQEGSRYGEDCPSASSPDVSRTCCDDSDPHTRGGGEPPGRAVERPLGLSAWAPFVTEASPAGWAEKRVPRAGGGEAPWGQKHLRPKGLLSWLGPHQVKVWSPLSQENPIGPWVRAVRNEPNGLLAPAGASVLIRSQMRTVVGVVRGRRQLGRVFSLGRNSLLSSGLGNARVSRVSKNKAKGSVRFDPSRGGEETRSQKGTCMFCL